MNWVLCETCGREVYILLKEKDNIFAGLCYRCTRLLSEVFGREKAFTELVFAVASGEAEATELMKFLGTLEN